MLVYFSLCVEIFFRTAEICMKLTGEQDMLQICYTDISNKATATATLVSLAMSVAPPRANLDIFFIYTRNISLPINGESILFVKLSKKPSSAQSVCAFLGFLIIFQRRMIVMIEAMLLSCYLYKLLKNILEICAVC